MVLEGLGQTDEHVTAELLARWIQHINPEIHLSTVYRTLDVFEEMGLIRHAHGADGREEYHVLPATDHGHLHCTGCGRSWELSPADAHALTNGLRRSRGFDVDLSHVSVSGRCLDCTEAAIGR